MQFTRPVPISPEMKPSFKTFVSHSEAMNQWLRQWALHNEEEGYSRTYATFCLTTGKLAGYYTLSNFAIMTRDLPASFQKKAPPAIPCMLLGRLAVDTNYEGQGLGRALVINAIRQTLKVSETSGIWGLVVHPLTPSLIRFYSNLNFQLSPNPEQLLMYYALRCNC